jgi:hypothetical protein
MVSSLQRLRIADCGLRICRTIHNPQSKIPSRLASVISLSLLALTGAARAAEYTVQATVTDIDDRPVAGVQVAVGSIKKNLLQSEVREEEVGTTDAAGQVTVKLSSDASAVGATVIGEEPGRIHRPADQIARLSKGTNQVVFQLLAQPDDMKMAAGGTAESRGYFGETGSEDRSFWCRGCS